MKKAISLKKTSAIILLLSLAFNPTLTFSGGGNTLLKAPAVPKTEKYSKLKKTIAIINFSSTSPSIDADTGIGITDMLITSLVKSGRFIVIEREKLDRVLAEQFLSGDDTKLDTDSRIKQLENKKQLAVTGMLTARTAVQIGKLLNTDTIITGRVINFGLAQTNSKRDYFIIGIEAHLISSQTGKTLAVCEAIAQSKNEVSSDDIKAVDWKSDAFIHTLIGQSAREAVGELVSEIEETMISYPWTGYIIKTADDKIYISGGKNIGLKKGDLLVILQETEITEDTATGAVTERKFKKTGEAEIGEIYEEYSVCTITDKNRYKEGYVVQLKQEYLQEDTEPQDKIPITGKINEEQHWKKIESLWNQLNNELYNKIGKDLIKLSSGGVYISPYQKITPKAQELAGQLEKEYEILAENNPNNSDIYNGWAWLNYNMNQFDKAIKMMEKAISLKPTEPELRSQLGSIYVSLLNSYKPTFGYNVDAIEGITMLTAIYRRNQDFGEQKSIETEIMRENRITQSDLERWRWEYIRNEETFLQMSGNDIDPKRYKQSIEQILYFTNINVWENYDKCIVVLSDITEQIKDNPLLWSSLGTAYGIKSLIEKKKDYMDRAEECLRKAVLLDPKSRWFHEHLAIICSLKGGYYTDGSGVSTVYLIDKGLGLGYEPKFLYPNPKEREKYKNLAIKEIATKDMLSKKKQLEDFEETRNNYPENVTEAQIEWSRQCAAELEEMKNRYPDIAEDCF